MTKQATLETDKTKKIPIYKTKPNRPPTARTTPQMTLDYMTIGEYISPFSSAWDTSQTGPVKRTLSITLSTQTSLKLSHSAQTITGERSLHQ
jgi:hypothetical protein